MIASSARIGFAELEKWLDLFRRFPRIYPTAASLGHCPQLALAEHSTSKSVQGTVRRAANIEDMEKAGKSKRGGAIEVVNKSKKRGTTRWSGDTLANRSVQKFRPGARQHTCERYI